LFVIGLAGLVIGYRRNSRQTRVVAAIVLLLSATVSDVARGLVDGFEQHAGIVAPAHGNRPG